MGGTPARGSVGASPPQMVPTGETVVKLVVVLGEAPWEPGKTFEASFPVQVEVIWGEPPWEVGRKLTATLDEPGDPSRPRIEP